MLKGQYSNSIDAKGRIVMPKKYRPALEDKVVVSRGLDGCLSVYPLKKWMEVEKKLAALPTTKKQARDYARLILSSAEDLELDKMGRINLPMHLIKMANLEKNCIIIGLGEYLEIWNEDKWNEYNQNVEESFEQIAESLVEFEL